MPKKRKAHKRDWPVFYVVDINNWDWSFSFGLDGSKYSSDPYSDYRHLEIVGSLIAPVDVKAVKVVVHLLPDKDLNQESHNKIWPLAKKHTSRK